MSAASDPPPPPSAAPRAGARARLRALAIAVALLVQCVTATPRKAIDAEHLARPEGRRTLDQLERALGTVGIAPGRPVIERELTKWSGRGIALRNAVLAPFAPLVRFAEIDQRWTLFVGTGPESFRMHVDGRRAGGRWRAIHRAPGDGGELAQRLRYRRVRGIYNPSVRRGPRPEYPGFARWLARELFTARPELDEVRVRMERLSTGAPGTEPVRVRFEHEHVHRRGEVL